MKNSNLELNPNIFKWKNRYNFIERMTDHLHKNIKRSREFPVFVFLPGDF